MIHKTAIIYKLGSYEPSMSIIFCTARLFAARPSILSTLVTT